VSGGGQSQRAVTQDQPGAGPSDVGSRLEHAAGGVAAPDRSERASRVLEDVVEGQRVQRVVSPRLRAPCPSLDAQP
jgi:hypothetical protein